MTVERTSNARVVVLISGNGSNLQAIIDRQASGELPITLCAVISNRDNVKGLERAQNHEISTIVLDHQQFESRETFDRRLLEIIDSQSPDIVVLAGFMRILTAEFTQHYEGRMINIHPSLLPKYQGLHTHQRAIDAGDAEAGATVHFVTAELDGGPPILQARVPICLEDTAQSLATKVQDKEHQILPLALRWLALGMLKMKQGQCFFRDEAIPASGIAFETIDNL